MSSLKSLAISNRNKNCHVYDNTERNRFVPAVLEIAHAISRGRKPTSCSQLPGENVQQWLRHMFDEIAPGCHDYMGYECSIADDVVDSLFGWDYSNPATPIILRAIKLCRRYKRPRRIPSKMRGDFEYQRDHKVTNRKKKLAWLQNKNGSCYDDIPNDFSPRGNFDPRTVVHPIRRVRIVTG